MIKQAMLLLFLCFLSGYLCASEYVDGCDLIKLANRRQWDKVVFIINRRDEIDINKIISGRPEDLPLLATAASQLNIEAMEYLIMKGADVNAPHPITPLMAAIWGHMNHDESGIPTITFLLKNGANILGKNSSNETCHEYLAVYRKNPDPHGIIGNKAWPLEGIFGHCATWQRNK